MWAKSKAAGKSPSEILGLRQGSYEAYCFDEAAIYFGMTLDNELQSAGHKPSKEDRRAEMARERILSRVFDDEKDQDKHYADPALMFK